MFPLLKITAHAARGMAFEGRAAGAVVFALHPLFGTAATFSALPYRYVVEAVLVIIHVLATLLCGVKTHPDNKYMVKQFISG